MKYAGIDKYEVVNGNGNGISLYVQGCHFRCPGCFNSDTWDFNGGKHYDMDTYEELVKLANKPYITRFSILGGEPLANENVEVIYSTIASFKKRFPDKKIWIYSGYKWNQIMNPVITDDFDMHRDMIIKCRKATVELADVLVDGRYEEDKKDLSLKFRGSSNQRIIDVQQSLKKGEIVLWQNN